MDDHNTWMLIGLAHTNDSRSTIERSVKCLAEFVPPLDVATLHSECDKKQHSLLNEICSECGVDTVVLWKRCSCEPVYFADVSDHAIVHMIGSDTARRTSVRYVTIIILSYIVHDMHDICIGLVHLTWSCRNSLKK